MDMAVCITGAGVRLSPVGISLGVSMGAYIAFRRSPSQVPLMMSLNQLVSLGNQAGALIAAGVATDWFALGSENEATLPSVEWLLGRELELKVSASLLARGRVDVELTAISEHGYPTTLVKSYGRKAKGFQIGEACVRGKAIRSHVNEWAYAAAIESGEFQLYEE